MRKGSHFRSDSQLCMISSLFQVGKLFDPEQLFCPVDWGMVAHGESSSHFVGWKGWNVWFKVWGDWKFHLGTNLSCNQTCIVALSPYEENVRSSIQNSRFIHNIVRTDPHSQHRIYM